MRKIYKRPLSDLERRSLKRSLEYVGSIRDRFLGAGSFRLRCWFGVSTAILGLCVVAFFVSVKKAAGEAGDWSGFALVPFLVGLMALGFVCLSGFGLGGRRKMAKERRSDIRAALEHGEAWVCSVTSDDVIVIGGSADAPAAFIYDLGDGTSFFLRGINYYNCDYNPDHPDGVEEPWPARQFEIVSALPNMEMVGVFGASGQLTPLRIVPINEMPESFATAEEPRTETVLQGRPEEVLAGLGYKPE